MADPEIISLAGGNPASELCPGDELSKLAGKILLTNPTLAVQYGTTDGYPKMRDCARKRAEKVNSGNENDAILIMTGANQGIDLTAKALLNKGDKVIVESPSFIGSLNAFRTYECELVGVTVEDDGMSMEGLEDALKNNSGVKFIYTIPTFQNPTGATMSLDKRKKMLELASKYDVLILEDNPYGDLRFSGEDVPTIKSLDTEGRVIYAGSFSKILSPGMRLGYIVAPAPLAEKIEILK
ncbi:MAG: PLP-dependent aminotransferase family protein, partial [Clostridia bacterium]|nr:PLP-dependent aminotransferase family protein [Clostridia bacterium]